MNVTYTNINEMKYKVSSKTETNKKMIKTLAKNSASGTIRQVKTQKLMSFNKNKNYLTFICLE